ncbi:hypothetical protein GLOTRDRAFT_116863 [Gloeophyllum trabeum ATCC 11539]|uniref:MARVEL domain-containing protein n=1 Tax=Gloeophyllum trabeum (strain ATCC 11539 / FP-39264 / Madison 617) TaxID=670483 RepID=S7RNG8_GLOTA|nr:uncharacterized protein GLOTRDRAFT_116863 [Gloeophyllum trabeum ATCC 11539]EPQ54314.1 hypothetical protein GLOTRDRAFT_116863 [Gloeophyllum trabeum ATCC 11539]
MTLFDRISDAASKVLPSRNNHIPAPVSGGIGNGHGMASFEDDMIVSKPAIIFHASQVFFNFLAMACFASVAAFQARFHVGPSGLSGFALFVSVAGIFMSTFLLLVPVLYEKYDKFTRLARALKEVRVGFILSGAGTAVSLLIAFITTISAWTEPGCKNAKNDPHAKEGGDDFVNGLPGWCSTKKAGAIFFWLAFGFWTASLVLTFLDWRNGRSLRPKDPPFQAPATEDLDEDDGDEESQYRIPPIRRMTAESEAAQSPFSDANRYSGASSTALGSAPGGFTAPAPSRPSMDAYGAFSDPPPSGFGAAPVADASPRVSRTMQYADPYAAVRASIAGAPPSTNTSSPPTYETYQGYQGY